MAVTSYTTTTDIPIRYIRSVQLVETSGSAAVRIQIKDTDTNGVPYVVLAAGAASAATFTPTTPIRFPSSVARLEFPAGAGRVTIDGY